VQFELIEKTVKVANVNFRAEKHGEDNKLACDIKIEAHCPASALDAFDPALRECLFRAPVAGEQQSLPMEDGEAKTERRCPKLSPLKWDEDFPGYKLEISEGLGLKKPLALAAELSKFQFEPLDGGSVKITFSASCYPDAKESGLLAEQIQEDVTITLKAPAPAEWPADYRPGDILVTDAHRVLVTECTITENRSLHLFETRVILSDGTPLRLSDLAYRPDLAQTIDLIKMDHNLDAEFAPALAAEMWPAKAA